MGNPCKECIVKSMCEESCNAFEKYVRDNVEIGTIGNDLISHLCNRIKEGVCELYDNDRGWRWKVKQDEKSM